MVVGGEGEVVIVWVQDAGIKKPLFPILLFVGGEHERTDAVWVQVDESEGLFHLGRPFQDIRLHHITLP